MDVAKIIAESESFRKQYRENHACCPDCKSVKVGQTLIGYILDIRYKADEYKDSNSCWCDDCGWQGIVDDLKPND